MEVLFIFAAAICVLYFVLIVAYSGIGTSFCFIWLFFAALCGAMSCFSVYLRAHRHCLPKRGIVFISTSLILGIVVMAVIMGLMAHTAAVPEKKKLDYVIVLGARVYPDKMSVSLKNRLDKAYEYRVENPETKFVLSGGQGDNEYLPEAVAMYNYLHLKGMPEENMILEMFSTSTTENIAFSMIAIDEDIKKTERDVIEDIKDSAQMKLRERIEFGIYPVERGVEFIEDSILGDNEGLSLKEAAEAAEEVRRTQVAADKGPSVGVLTNDFHVMRAVLIAKKRGFENVSGISAPSDPILLPHFFVRECAAIIKDRIMGNM